MIRNTDGRYWIFTTGSGIWTMSSSNANFTDWRAENPVFRSGWPSWIANYVSGFNGNFWAPDVIKSGSTYYCYYSCAGTGAPAAIGLATATNLSGPWTDQGMIVAGNNAIDPAPLQDGTNWYLAYGNWQTGIDIIQLSSSTGKRQGSTIWHVIPNQQVEAPYLMKNGSYYYLFFQRGLCCNGTSSTYYTQVGRSTSIGGPYVDRAGVALTSGGGTTFLPNRDRRFIGPGHVGYGEGKLTFHFYDGQDSGNAKLRITTLQWSNGWPVADDVQPVAPSTYSLRNRASGKMLDNLSVSTDGANVGQWSDGTATAQRWTVSYSGGFYKLSCGYGGKFLDSLGHTADGSTVGQWASGSSTNQQWTIEDAGGGYYRVINRANGKSLDTGGGTADGAIMQFWPPNPSNNQLWQFVAP
jgi:arabinan endo-1,5-alpha-L-arabinosidase